MGPLHGIRVIDLTMWAFVPAAGGILSHWGADVIKVESPKAPDPSRLFGGSLEPGGASRSFNNYNRGKRGIALDLATPEGREILYKLVENADVFLTSLLPAVRKKLGVDVDDIRSRNPKIIYAKGSGLGPKGPESDKRGFDAAMWWARSGLAHTAMEAAGASAPVSGAGHGDTMCGTVLAGGICAALVQRSITGKGSVVDGSLLSTAIWFNHQPIIATSPGLPADTAVNQGMAGGAPAGLGTYRTKDGRFISLILLNDPDHEWNDLAKCLGHPELSSDPRFADRAARANYRPEARALLEEIFGSLTLDELRVLLDKMTGVWAPFQTPAEIHNDPQVIANRFLQEVDYPGGALNLPTPPVLFDEEALPAKRAPDFAQHTDEVLREFGFNDGDLARHRAAGVIA